MTKRRIFYLSAWCEEHGISGGQYKLYHHVDLLNTLGFNALVVHTTQGAAYPFYPRYREVPILYVGRSAESLFDLSSFSPQDILVIKSEWVPFMAPFLEKLSLFAALFNQGAYLSFQQSRSSPDPFSAALLKGEKNYFLSPQILGSIVVSRDNQRFLRSIFPKEPLHLVRTSFDAALFTYQSQKKRQMAYMTKKFADDALAIVHTIQARGRLPTWSFLPIEGMDQQETAKAMQESALFLYLSYSEGLPLTPREAISSGTLVIGTAKGGGREVVKPPLAFPVNHERLIEYVQEVERVALDFEKRPLFYQKLGEKNARLIQKRYSEEQEISDLAQAWKQLIHAHEKRLK